MIPNSVLLTLVLLYFLANGIALAGDSTEILTLGIPVSQKFPVRVPHHEDHFFVRMILLSPEPSDLVSIILSPSTGGSDIDLSLCINIAPSAHTSSYPDPDTCQNYPNCTISFSSHHSGFNVISFPGRDVSDVYGSSSDDDLLRIVVFSVLEDVESSGFVEEEVEYSLNIFTTQTQVRLSEGTPQLAALPNQFFTFGPIYNREDLTVSVTPVVLGGHLSSVADGDPDVYVSAIVQRPDVTTASWKVWLENKVDYDVVTAHASDEIRFVTGPQPWGVHVFQVPPGEVSTPPSYFVVVWSFMKSYTRLSEGLSLGGMVGESESRYYNFTLLQNSSCALVVTVLNRYPNGDPDLFVNGPSRDPSHQPSRTWNEWSSEGKGNEVVRILNPVAGTYSIAVYGYSEATFEIVVTVERTRVRMVSSDDEPLHVTVPASDYVYFRFRNCFPDDEFAFRAAAKEGKGGLPGLEMYISLPSSHNVHPQRESWKHDRVGTPTAGMTSVVGYVPRPSTVGEYAFSLYASGFTPLNVTVTVSVNVSHTLLPNGAEILYNEVPQDFYRFFVFDLSRSELFNRCDDPLMVVFAVVALGDGQVSLYVDDDPENDSPGSPVDHHHSRWKSEQFGACSIVIPLTDETRSLFYVGVRGGSYRELHLFSIVAYVSTLPVELMEGTGRVQEGAVAFRERNEYKFYLHTPSKFRICLSEWNSQDVINFYVNHLREAPSVLDHQYKSENGIVALGEAQPGWYYISVVGEHVSEGQAHYDLSLVVSFRQVKVNQREIIGITEAGAIEQVRAYLPAFATHVLVSLFLISGRTRLLVSPNVTSHGVGPLNRQWEDSGWPGNALVISTADPEFRVDQEWGLGIEALALSNYRLAIGFRPNPGGAILTVNFPRLVRMPRCSDSSCPFYWKFRFSTGGVWTGVPASQPWFVRIRVRQGNVGVYIDQSWETDPLPSTNATWQSEGSHDRIVLLNNVSGPQQFLEGEALVVVRCLDVDRDSLAEITAYPAMSPTFVRHDEGSRVTLASVPSYFYGFAVWNLSSAVPIHVYISSCSNAPVETAYFNIQNLDDGENLGRKFPTREKHDISSETLAQGCQIGSIVEFVSIEQDAHSWLFYFALQSSLEAEVEIFMTSDEDLRPIPVFPFLGQKTTDSRDVGDVFVLEIPAVVRSLSEPEGERLLTYVTFIRVIEVYSSGPDVANFGTVCAITALGTEVDRFNATPSSEHPLVPLTVSTGIHGYLTSIELNVSTLYALNVVVSDELGLRATYEPIYVHEGLLIRNLDSFEVDCGRFRCYGKTTNENPCSYPNGECVGQDLCLCSPGYDGNECQRMLQCYDKTPEENACSYPNGECVSHDHCVCASGFVGRECEQFLCYGTNPVTANACSYPDGHCTGLDHCVCASGFVGKECEQFLCFGKNPATDEGVCSSPNGHCVAKDFCQCETGFSGSQCEEILCFGKSSAGSACSFPHGSCVNGR